MQSGPLPDFTPEQSIHYKKTERFPSVFLLYSLYMTWAGKRQLAIVGSLFVIGVIILAVIIVPKLNKPATCFDTKQNGDEHGVDCGGECLKFCPFEVSDVKVRWTRSFPITEDVWSAVAYIENQNVNAGAYNVKYEFRFYDADHKFITVREGETFIGPNSNSAIYESAIKVSNRIPKYTQFKFLENPAWIVTDRRIGDLGIFSKNEVLADLDTNPKFKATIYNQSQVYGIDNIDVIAILYDAEDNAIAVAKTYVEGLAPTVASDVYFTWPQVFDSVVARKEIVTRYNPFKVSFQ